MWRTIIVAGFLSIAACAAPVSSPPAPSGEVIAFGGGPGGASDACFTCHGLKGEGDGLSPRLAGLSAGYLLKQLEDYAGRWRSNSVMSPVAGRLSDADRLAVATYYADLPEPTPRLLMPAMSGERLYLNGDLGRGLKACGRCHGSGGHGQGLAAPRLAGQTSVYVAAQLSAWKDSRRRNDPQDVMGAIARQLTNQEIEHLASYVEALP